MMLLYWHPPLCQCTAPMHCRANVWTLPKKHHSSTVWNGFPLLWDCSEMHVIAAWLGIAQLQWTDPGQWKNGGIILQFTAWIKPLAGAVNKINMFWLLPSLSVHLATCWVCYATLHTCTNRAMICPDVWVFKGLRRRTHKPSVFKYGRAGVSVLLKDVITFKCTSNPAVVINC